VATVTRDVMDTASACLSLLSPGRTGGLGSICNAVPPGRWRVKAQGHPRAIFNRAIERLGREPTRCSLTQQPVERRLTLRDAQCGCTLQQALGSQPPESEVPVPIIQECQDPGCRILTIGTYCISHEEPTARAVDHVPRALVRAGGEDDRGDPSGAPRRTLDKLPR
jgi:hypothetical protein